MRASAIQSDAPCSCGHIAAIDFEIRNINIITPVPPRSIVVIRGGTTHNCCGPRCIGDVGDVGRIEPVGFCHKATLIRSRRHMHYGAWFRKLRGSLDRAQWSSLNSAIGIQAARCDTTDRGDLLYRREQEVGSEPPYTERVPHSRAASSNQVLADTSVLRSRVACKCGFRESEVVGAPSLRSS